MSHEEKLRQIKNGLEVVDLVKKIRAGPIEKPTYGRSAIGAPSTKERANAWELFHQSTLDEAGSNEPHLEEGDDNTNSRNDMGISDDTLHAIGGRARTYKESDWDDGEEPILENKLAANIQQHDPGRTPTDSKSDHTYAGCRDNRAEGSRQGHGCAEINKSNLPFIFQSNLSQDPNVEDIGTKNEGKYTMNPNAKEYIPIQYQGVSKSESEPQGEHGANNETVNVTTPDGEKVQSSDGSRPSVKPRMIRHMQSDPQISCDACVIDPIILTKQRMPIPDISEIDEPPKPISLSKAKLELLYEEDEDQESIPIEDVDKDKFGSQDTIFDLSDTNPDNERRNVMAAKTIGKIISDSLKDDGVKEGVIYLSEKPVNPVATSSHEDGKRKLKALEKTKAGKGPEGLPTSDVKKGIEKNTVSTGMDQKSKSKNGAILNVQESRQNQQKRSAPVDNVQSTVKMRNARESSTSEDDSAVVVTSSVAESPQSADSISFDDYFEKLSTQLTQQDLLKEIYRNQLSVLSKLNENSIDADSFKVLINNQRATLAKLDALDRNVSKLGLAVSSMEQMLASMRIMIPGKPIEEGNKPKNPTLKPVIGRDTVKAEEVINIDPDKASTGGCNKMAKSNLFLEPLNSQKTNATQFIPENDSVSKKTLSALVINRIRDDALRRALLSSLEKATSQETVTKLHAHIKEAIAANL
ncbi:phosphoprotein [Wenzhou Apodemus agrarius henipavirus 1]|uniref:Phosphoprotein n=1 Tax=Wenzhou Apodemus agrarius henipavirus 1 TaxID=2877509 RepID=A0AAE9BU53_9MONO|nr:phosphoprotein [Wenzhou Apodemus agrarius henipavirus 1]